MGKYDDLLKGDTDNVVELARAYGPDIVEWLHKVVQNKWSELEFTASIPLQARLMAADLLRKFAAIPTNVDFSIKAPPIIEYLGDAPLKVIDVAATPNSVPILPRPDPESAAVAGPSGRTTSDVRRHGRSVKKRKDNVAG